MSLTDNTLVGTWKANSPKIAVTKRKYNLKKQDFKYGPNLELSEDLAGQPLFGEHKITEEAIEAEVLSAEALKLNASKTLLKKEDVENLYKGDLEVVRNAIYARHGYSFQNRKMRYFFDSHVDWYMPVSVDVRGQLTTIERKNIDLLKRYEQHAEQYYDVFGR